VTRRPEDKPLVAIVGGGQLGMMLGEAGADLGVDCRFLDPNPASPARNASDLIVGEYDDPAALERLIAGARVATYEFENVPAAAAAWLAQRLPVRPPPQALEAALDRLAEKTLLRELGVPVPIFEQVDREADLRAAVERIGLPCVLKTRRLGYDGRGQALLRDESNIATAWERIGRAPAILEAFVPFDRELSIISARRPGGETAFYPIVQNRHADGILRESIAPAPCSSPEHFERLQALAERHAVGVLERLDYVGVLAIEFFECDGELLANEMAPRVHNSGHWSIEGAAASQFENHLRAVLDLDLAPTDAHGAAAMINIIGSPPRDLPAIESLGAHAHMYAKKARPGRKLGHVTLVADDHDALREQMERLYAATALDAV